ncbi:MAG: hypothetical protein JWM71_821 [Solirubrobacteraceae bacterium]|nr:hypothetical protein [Solirubrobacteraceae bacterium]
MHRSVPLTVAAVGSLVGPVGLPLMAVADAATPAPAHVASAGRLVVGSTVNMKWGGVQVRIRLNSAGKRIINVGAVVPTERSRSKQINDRAVPILKSEVLRAQSANIHAVSGATMTSNAYVQSLRNALSKAHL